MGEDKVEENKMVLKGWRCLIESNLYELALCWAWEKNHTPFAFTNSIVFVTGLICSMFI